MVKREQCVKDIIKFGETIHEYLMGCGCVKETDASFEAISKDPKIKEAFFNGLGEVEAKLSEDLDFFLESDPAISEEDEVIYAYPGYKAITYYRVANLLYKLGLKFESFEKFWDSFFIFSMVFSASFSLKSFSLKDELNSTDWLFLELLDDVFEFPSFKFK